ncbi:MAG: extracellular solute-binding protein, partial [bacterium]
MRRILLSLFVLLVIVAVAVIGLYWYAQPLPVLKITTWAGKYGRAQRVAMIEPYRDIAQVDTKPGAWDGDLAEVERAVASRSYKGDVIDFELPEAVAGCRKGLLEKFDASTLPRGAGGTVAKRDFVAGAVGDCWVASVVYSQVIVYARDKFTGRTPRTLADFFDTARFPGRRALREGAKYNLEMALLADGVAPGDVYRVLESPEGPTRAFRKLDTIKPYLLWWHDAGEPVNWIHQGKVAFATALSGSLFEDRAFGPGVIWDRQLYEFDVFGVPRGDPNRALAMAFIRYATGTNPLARVADWV